MVILLSDTVNYATGATTLAMLLAGGVVRGIVLGRRKRRAMRQYMMDRAAVDPVYAEAMRQYFARGGKW